jgi:exonuclease III
LQKHSLKQPTTEIATTTSQNETIKIIEWNINGIGNLQKLDKSEWKFLFNSDIIALTETWHINDAPWKKKLEKDFLVYDTSAIKEKSKGRPSGGIILLISKILEIKKINLIDSSKFFILIEIFLENSALVIGVFYFSPALSDESCTEIMEQCLINISQYNNENIVLIGDLNSRFGALNQIPDETLDIGNINLYHERKSNDEKTNKRGILMCEIFEFFGYTLLNGRSKGDCPAKFTYVGLNGRSVIDVAWVNERALTNTTNFQVHYSSYVSDHFPCVLELMVPKKPKTSQTKRSQQVDKIKWDRDKASNYTTTLRQSIESSQSKTTLFELLQAITTTAKNLGMQKTVKLSNSNQVPENPWFNNECRNLKKELRGMAWKMKKENSNAHIATQYKELRKNYLVLIKNSKQQYEDDLRFKLSNVRNSDVFWKTVNSFKPKKIVESSINLETWKIHLENLQKPFEVQTDFSVPCVILDEELDRDIEMVEITQILRKLKPNKSPGPDEISNEFLINLPENALQILQRELNSIFNSREWPEEWTQSDIKMLHKKGNVDNPENYRPIALENSSFKLLTSILNARLTKWAEKNKIIPEFQNGFRSGRGCVDNIFVINSLIELTINQKQNNAIFAIFIDFKGAYDNINHQKLWPHLHKNLVSSKIILTLKKIYETFHVRIATSLGKTELVKLLRGLLQGDPLSPFAFNIYINDLEAFLRRQGFKGLKIAEGIDILLLAYADDVVIFAKSPGDLRDKLTSIEQYCQQKDLVINVDKTKIVIFKKRINKKHYQNYKLNQKSIEIVDEFKYLGTHLYRTGNWDREMEHRIASANLALSKLHNLILSEKNTSWETKTTLISSMIDSVLLYGAEIWGAYSTDKMTTTQLKIFKRLLYLPQNTPGYAVIREAGIQPIETLILKRTLRWWTKLLNAPGDSYIKICYNKLRQTSDENWANRIREKIFVGDLLEIWNNQTMNFNDASWNQTLSYHQVQWDNFVTQKIENSSSLYWYGHLQAIGNTFAQSHLNLKLPTSTINAFCQLRLLNKHNEKIYINGNSYKFKNNENCTICNFNEPDTLMHLLTRCNITAEIRRSYLETNSKEEVIMLLNDCTKENVLRMVSFMKHSLRIRSFILFE